MTLEQLRVFVAVAEREHVTQAAQSLNLAQSAVSHSIGALEGEFRVKLFNRVGRGIELTEAGRLFLEEAKAVLSRAAAARLRLAELGDGAAGTLLIQASQTIASYWLPSRLKAFRSAFPRVEIALTIANTRQVAQAIHDGNADIGFIEGTIDDPELQVTVVARDRLVVVVDPDHPWAGRHALAADELTGSEWVLREPGSGTRSAFEAALAAAGVEPDALRVAMVLPSNEAVRAAAEAGLGATALSASVAAPSLEAGLLCQVSFPLPERSFAVVQHRDRHPSRAAQAILKSVLSACLARG